MAENKATDTAKAEVTEAKKNVKKADKKPSIFSRIGKFFREYKAEMKKVTWASREDTLKNTIVVAISVAIVGVALFVLDTAFEEGILLLGKLI